jgi:flagellar hook-basal body complex protein FliE
MIEALEAINSVLADLQSLAGAASAPPSSQLIPDASASDGAAAPTFSQALRGALERVDGTISNANAMSAAFSSGDKSIPLSDAMVSLEQANLALQMASGVRDKVVAAYTTVMNMQI